jgi:hypothetical protein
MVINKKPSCLKFSFLVHRQSVEDVKNHELSDLSSLVMSDAVRRSKEEMGQLAKKRTDCSQQDR